MRVTYQEDHQLCIIYIRLNYFRVWILAYYFHLNKRGVSQKRENANARSGADLFDSWDSPRCCAVAATDLHLEVAKVPTGIPGMPPNSTEREPTITNTLTVRAAIVWKDRCNRDVAAFEPAAHCYDDNFQVADISSLVPK